MTPAPPTGEPAGLHPPGGWTVPPRRTETTLHPEVGITIEPLRQNVVAELAHRSDGTLVPPPTTTGPFANGPRAFGDGVGFELPDGAA